MRENMRILLRRAVPAVVLASVTAMPAMAAAAPEPPRGQGPDSASPPPQQTAAVDPRQAAYVRCAPNAGDEALTRAIRAGGRIALQPNCTYTVTGQHGRNSALPEITRDTTIEGRDSVIEWRGRAKVPTLIETAGENVRFVVRGVALKPGPGMAAVRTRAGSSGSIEMFQNDGAAKTPSERETAQMLAAWLAPKIRGLR